MEDNRNKNAINVNEAVEKVVDIQDAQPEVTPEPAAEAKSEPVTEAKAAPEKRRSPREAMAVEMMPNATRENSRPRLSFSR